MARYGFCFTLNNYTPAQVTALKGAVGQCGIQYIVFGYEVGEQNGTPHLQGYLQSNQKNKSRFHETFEIYVKPQEAPKAIDAAIYCKKDEDFFEAGTFDPTVKGTKGKKQGYRSDLAGVREAVIRGESYEEICETHFEAAAKYGKFIKEQVSSRASRMAQDSLRSACEELSLHPWEQEILVDIVAQDPHPRKIHWIWEKVGNVGKSTFANYLGLMHDALVIDAGKKADLTYIFGQNPKKLIVIDLPRTLEPSGKDESKMDHLYNIAEQLKNCRLTMTKYESKVIYFPCPTVIFFANFPPDLTKWSADRYAIKEI